MHILLPIWQEGIEKHQLFLQTYCRVAETQFAQCSTHTSIKDQYLGLYPILFLLNTWLYYPSF